MAGLTITIHVWAFAGSVVGAFIGGFLIFCIFFYGKNRAAFRRKMLEYGDALFKEYEKVMEIKPEERKKYLEERIFGKSEDKNKPTPELPFN